LERDFCWSNTWRSPLQIRSIGESFGEEGELLEQRKLEGVKASHLKIP
jgi:hypothetical protein